MPDTIRYIALVRGINVGGYRKIKMADLRKMIEKKGFKNVATYIQSGNIVFNAPSQNHFGLAQRIQQEIKNTFGHDVPAIVITATALEEIIAAIPFESKEGWKRYITFLSGQPEKAPMQNLIALSGTIEKFQAGKQVIYVHIDKQTSTKPKFSNALVEKHLKVSATNRNVRTAQKILALATNP